MHTQKTDHEETFYTYYKIYSRHYDDRDIREQFTLLLRDRRKLGEFVRHLLRKLFNHNFPIIYM